MTWFVLALIAPLLWAIVNLIDDKLLQSVYRSANFGAMISGLFGFLPGFYFFVTNEQIITEPEIVAAALLAGFLTVVFYFFYFRTLSAEEPSVAITLFSLAPAIVPFLSFGFLGEVLYPLQYLGLTLVVGAAFVLSAIDIRRLRFSSALYTATIGSLAFAAISVLSKYAYSGGTFREIYAWIAFGFGIGGLAFLLFSGNKQEFKGIIKSSKTTILITLVAAELINIAAELTQGAAIKGGPVSIVRGMEGIQPLYVLLIGVTLSPFFPKHFREVKDRRLPKKLFLMLVSLIGLYFISQSN